MDINATILTPADVDATGDQTPFALEQCERRYLAQGDSWFSIGAFPPGLTSNILMAPLVLSKSTAIVNCAKPGAVLRNMVDHVREAQFAKFLKLGGYHWDALLISGGGNDFIDFAGRGMEEEKALRLFLTPQERGSNPPAPAGYISEEGWTHFSGMLREAFRTLFSMQDGGNSPDAPVVCHTYAYLTPRPSPAGPGIGPWLKCALDNYKIPAGKELRLAVNRQEVVCRFEPEHRGDVADAAMRSVPVVVVLPARQGLGSLG